MEVQVYIDMSGLKILKKGMEEGEALVTCEVEKTATFNIPITVPIENLFIGESGYIFIKVESEVWG